MLSLAEIIKAFDFAAAFRHNQHQLVFQQRLHSALIHIAFIAQRIHLFVSCGKKYVGSKTAFNLCLQLTAGIIYALNFDFRMLLLIQRNELLRKYLFHAGSSSQTQCFACLRSSSLLITAAAACSHNS